MNSSAIDVRFDDSHVVVDPADGRTIAVPLAWFPRKLNASPEQRAQVQFSARGLHWEAIDEDVSIDALPAGVGNLSPRSPTAV